MPEPTAVIPAGIVESVTKAIETTFATICGAKPTVAVCSGEKPACSGVVGIISFLGDQSFTIGLMLPEDAAVRLAQQFAGFEIPFDGPDMGDVIGELANVVAGDVVANLDRFRIKSQMSLPMVARGHDVELITPTSKPEVRLECKCPQGRFWCKIVTAKPGSALGRRPGT
jgi:CheY-specific phosphatase CheX